MSATLGRDLTPQEEASVSSSISSSITSSLSTSLSQSSSFSNSASLSRSLSIGLTGSPSYSVTPSGSLSPLASSFLSNSNSFSLSGSPSLSSGYFPSSSPSNSASPSLLASISEEQKNIIALDAQSKECFDIGPMCEFASEADNFSIVTSAQAQGFYAGSSETCLTVSDNILSNNNFNVTDVCAVDAQKESGGNDTWKITFGAVGGVLLVALIAYGVGKIMKTISKNKDKDAANEEDVDLELAMGQGLKDRPSELPEILHDNLVVTQKKSEDSGLARGKKSIVPSSIIRKRDSFADKGRNPELLLESMDHKKFASINNISNSGQRS
jgi:hypothetical protein